MPDENRRQKGTRAMTEVTNQQPDTRDNPTEERPRKAAIGKALIVWLATGSVGAAIVAYLVFAGMGC
jgi:hypothetical protein